MRATAEGMQGWVGRGKGAAVGSCPEEEKREVCGDGRENSVPFP